MFDSIKKWLSAPATDPHPELDPQIAAAALLVEAALADGVYADSEEIAIRACLITAFGLDEAQAAHILNKAEELAEEAVDHYRFTKVVKACLGETERAAIVEHLWTITLADGEKSPFEEAFIRKVSPLLAVDDRERAFARSRAEAKARAR